MLPMALSGTASVCADCVDARYAQHAPETTLAMLRADFAIYDGSPTLWSGASGKIVRVDAIDDHLKMLLSQDHVPNAIPDGVRNHFGSLQQHYGGRPELLVARRLSALAAFFISLHDDAAFNVDGRFDKPGFLHFVRQRLPGFESGLAAEDGKYGVFDAMQRYAGHEAGISVNGSDVLKTPKGALFFTDVPKDGLRQLSLPNVAVLQKRLCDLDLAEVDLSGARFHGCTFQNVNFDKTNLNNATFSLCGFSGVHFIDATMRRTEFKDCFLDTCQFLRCEMPQAKFIGASLGATTMYHCNMKKVAIGRRNDDSSGARVGLNSVQISACDLTRATIDAVDWRRGGISASVLDSVVVNKSSFAHMSWKGIVGEAASAASAVLSRSSFHFCDMAFLDMMGSRWSKCAVRDCHLDSIVSQGSTLDEMVIADTAVRAVDFGGAQVTKLSVSDGVFIHVSFAHSRLTDTTFGASPVKGRLDLRSVDFQACELANLVFERCDIDMAAEQLRQVFGPKMGPT